MLAGGRPVTEFSRMEGLLLQLKDEEAELADVLAGPKEVGYTTRCYREALEEVISTRNESATFRWRYTGKAQPV